MKPILLSGTSNLPLAKAIAKHLNFPLGDIEITRFIDNECRVYIKENVANQNVFVIQSLSQIADQHLVELCLIGQALKSLKAKHVTAVIPWMGYSKQDKEFRKGEAVSAQLVAKFIESAGFDSVMTVELHSENVVPYFHIPVMELSTHDLFGSNLISLKGFHPTRLKGITAVVSPDTGGKSRSEHFARSLKLNIVYLEKSRDTETGEVKITGVHGNVKDTNVIIFDDIINTGATAIKTSEFLKKHGAGKIYFLATHGVLAGDAGQKLLKSQIDQIIVTDTIRIPPEKMFPKLRIVSVSSLLARAIGGNVE